MSVGRPTKYTIELAQEICDAISCDSKGLRRLCEDHPHWPERRNIYHWMRKYPDFRLQYMQAKEHQIEALVDEILEIADDASHDTIIKTDKNGNEYESCNTEWMNRSRLRIETRKWLAAKLAPKIYGDKSKEEAVEENISFMQRMWSSMQKHYEETEKK